MSYRQRIEKLSNRMNKAKQNESEWCHNAQSARGNESGLHRDEQNGCLGCGVNISVGNEQIFIRTRWAGRAGSRLHDSIVMCSIAPEMVELFKKSECWHWALWVKVSDLGRTNNPNTTPIKGLRKWASGGVPPRYQRGFAYGEGDASTPKEWCRCR